LPASSSARSPASAPRPSPPSTLASHFRPRPTTSSIAPTAAAPPTSSATTSPAPTRPGRPRSTPARRSAGQPGRTPRQRRGGLRRLPHPFAIGYVERAKSLWCPDVLRCAAGAWLGPRAGALAGRSIAASASACGFRYSLAQQP
jgi:hypothetical protein